MWRSPHYQEEIDLTARQKKIYEEKHKKCEKGEINFFKKLLQKEKS